MLSLLNEVVDVQDELVERSWSVIRLAVDNGIDVNKDTTSKDTIVSFGSISRSFMCWRNVLTLLMECGEDFTRGWRMVARYFDSLNVGEPGRERIGCSGTFGFCLFGCV